MLIKGFQGLTTVDFPMHLACIVFTAGCNMRCGYCYNRDLALNSTNLPQIKEEDIFNFLKKRKGLLEGVVITGGEPTMHSGLPDFIRKIKELGFKVKLDTNGTNPKMLHMLLADNLLDYIAMDIKQVPEKYEDITRLKINMNKINETIELIRSSGVDYEFRTTASPFFISKEDFVSIGKWLKGSRKYCLQQFKALPGMIDESLADRETYSREDLVSIKKELEPYFNEIEIRV